MSETYSKCVRVESSANHVQGGGGGNNAMLGGGGRDEVIMWL